MCCGCVRVPQHAYQPNTMHTTATNTSTILSHRVRTLGIPFGFRVCFQHGDGAASNLTSMPISATKISFVAAVGRALGLEGHPSCVVCDLIM